MTTIRTTTKRGQTMYNNALENYEGYSLDEVFGTYSHAKRNAWDYCLRLCKEEGGYNFRIISHNTFGFSVAWDIINPEYGNIEKIRIETPKNSYLIIVE